jgi:hypothetical protein
MVQRMRLRSDRLQSLASPAFIAALALLVVNDVALKPLLHNALTGKLSDFAGLFALTLFAATLWPRQGRLAAWAIAGLFTFWKTTYAEPLIEALNALSPFALGRTVDLTDLAALPMIPLAAWAAPRLKPWPLPRALQVGLAVLAPLAFAATSQQRHVVRSILDTSSVAVGDEAPLQPFFDEVAGEHGLRCSVCDSLDDGRVYSRHEAGDSALESLTVNFDSERRQLFYTTSAFGRRGREGALALSADIRAGMQERFPGVTAIEFVDGADSQSRNSTTFTIHVPTEGALSVETVEQAKRTLSSIVEAVVRTHGLRVEADAPVYYAGGRFGTSAYNRDLVLQPYSTTNATLQVRVARQTENYAELYEAINADLAARLGAAFGSSAVTREDFPPE